MLTFDTSFLGLSAEYLLNSPLDLHISGTQALHHVYSSGLKNVPKRIYTIQLLEEM